MEKSGGRFHLQGSRKLIMTGRAIILGANGRLGAALYRLWSKDYDATIIPLTRKEMDFSNSSSAVETLARCDLREGDFVVNCAALTDVDCCEEEPTLAMTVNTTTPSLLAELCAKEGVRFLHLSTDYVFDGTLDRSYRETDFPAPLSHYGVSKSQGEQGVLAASSHHVIARVSWVFGPDRLSFIDQIIQRALVSKEVAAVHDKTSSPSFTHDLALWLRVFFTSSIEGGIYHLCNTGVCSWRDYGAYALQTAARYGVPVLTTEVAPLTLASMKNFRAQRPLKTALDTSKFQSTSGLLLRPWQEAVEEYIKKEG